MCRYVKQKDPYGCAIACLAMVTGYPYEYVRDYYSGKDFKKEGLSFHTDVEFLTDNGFSVNWKYKTYQSKGINGTRKEWPPRLWADIHIVSVITHNNRPHAIVMKKDGTIFDPNNSGHMSLNSYKEVSQVIGVYRNA